MSALHHEVPWSRVSWWDVERALARRVDRRRAYWRRADGTLWAGAGTTVFAAELYGVQS